MWDDCRCHAETTHHYAHIYPRETEDGQPFGWKEEAAGIGAAGKKEAKQRRGGCHLIRLAGGGSPFPAALAVEIRG